MNILVKIKILIISIVKVDNNDLMRIVYSYQIINTVLISEEHLSFQFLDKEVYVNREKYRRLLMNEYSIEMSVYYEGFYLQYSFNTLT